ncbi:MAG: hypothetical protein P4L92_22965 [Rudaea sp.]|nr:hypothetical protein [Rudaea sp.]
MFAALIGKLAGASGLSWLRFLPWALLAWGASIAGTGAWGWHQGAKITAAHYEAEKDKAAAVSAAAFAKSIEHAAGITQNILSIARDYVSELNLTRQRRVQIVEKVRADAKANVAASCVVPAATAGLRRQQVDESTAIAADDSAVRR